MAYAVKSTDPAYLKAAFADLGLSEVQGPRHSARVLQLFKDAGHAEIHDDETAWCAAAVGGWLHEGGFPNTGSLMARSYAQYGVPCFGKTIPRGAIIVWPRGKPPSGHVNICLEDDGTYLTCIGGNQSNGHGGGVTISRELKAHHIAARLPVGVKSAPVPLLPQMDEEEATLPPPQPVERESDTSVVSVDGDRQTKSDEIQTSAESDAETRSSWAVRKWRGLTGWFSGVGGIGVLGYLTDPWVVVAIGGVVIVVIVGFILFMGPGDVRAWIRKQVA